MNCLLVSSSDVQSWNERIQGLMFFHVVTTVNSNKGEISRCNSVSQILKYGIVRAVSKILILGIILVIIALSFLGLYFSGNVVFRTRATSYYVKLIGICEATGYFQADTASFTVSNFTITTDSTTTYSSYTIEVPAPVLTTGSTTYTTIAYATNSTSYSTTNATTSVCNFSLCWVISSCTFSPASP